MNRARRAGDPFDTRVIAVKANVGSRMGRPPRGL
jgi:hypothetical protein